MIRLIKNKDKYRFVNTEKINNDEKNIKIFINTNIKFSYTYNINNIGKYNSEKGMVNLLMDDDKCYIPKIDTDITETMFYFIKGELEKIINNYGNIIKYEVICEDEDNTMKNDVLRVEFDKIFDKWGMKIVYQDERLERGIFTDSKIKVSSNYNIEYDRINNWLYILGKNKGKDNNIIVVSDEEKEIIEDKVKRINENYGVEKRWRAENGKGYYYITNSNFGINIDFEHNDVIDNIRYELGNYFKNKELAGSKIKEIKELLLR